jgi:hypothetical protein
MKKVALIVAICSLAVACKKDVDRKNPKFDLRALNVIATAKPQSSGILIAPFAFSVRNANDVTVEKIQYKFSGTIPITKLQNFRTVIRDQDSMTLRNVATTTVSSNSLFLDVNLPIDRSGDYAISITTGFQTGTMGTIAVAIKITYVYDDGKIAETEFVDAPLIRISPYSTAPTYEKVSTSESIQDSTEQTLLSFTTSNTGLEAFGHPQYAFQVTMTDPDNDDNMKLSGFRWLVEDIDSTGTVRFVGKADTITTAIFEGITNLSVMKISNTRDWRNLPGSISKYTLVATLTGAKNKNNAIKTKLRTNIATSYQPMFLAMLGQRLGLRASQTTGTTSDGGTIWGIVGPGYSAFPAIGISSFVGNGQNEGPENLLHQ